MVHDRTLHDGESYNDAYENSLASIQSYLAKYPSIVYVLDLHRDAVQDANGTQYKLVTAEDPAAAQVSLIMAWPTTAGRTICAWPSPFRRSWKASPPP